MLFLRIKNAYRSLPLSVCWYDLSGRRIESASSQHGIYLRQAQYANGSVVCEILVSGKSSSMQINIETSAS